MLRNNAYVRVNRAVPFNRIAFFNYFFRPAVFKTGIRSAGIEEADLKVSGGIMRWFVEEYCPRLVIIASKLAGGYAISSLKSGNIAHCVICHPMYKRGQPFREEAERCLKMHRL